MEIESVIHSMEVDIRSEKILEAQRQSQLLFMFPDLEDQYAQLDKLSKVLNPNFKTGDRPKSWYVSVKQIVNNVTMVLDDLWKILTDLAGDIIFTLKNFIILVKKLYRIRIRHYSVIY